MPRAWAVEVKPRNFQAIVSESGGSLDLELITYWLQDQEGYFLRSPDDPLDCTLIATSSFQQLFTFLYDDEGVLFRSVIRI